MQKLLSLLRIHGFIYENPKAYMRHPWNHETIRNPYEQKEIWKIQTDYLYVHDNRYMLVFQNKDNTPENYQKLSTLLDTNHIEHIKCSDFFSIKFS